MFIDEWQDAPEWAKFKARDADGATFWYEHKPNLSVRRWDNTMIKPICRVQLVTPPTLTFWRDSLIER